MALRVILWAAQLAFVTLTLGYLAFFVDHALRLLSFAYPLDYGEGPLLAQIERLRAGVSIGDLYANPAEPPFLIVNYPPLYLVLTAAISRAVGSVLFAGRLLSLAATLATVIALMALIRRSFPERSAPSPFRLSLGLFVPLLFLTVPIVREWSALLRVDMLGISLGLWSLVVLGGGVGPPGPVRVIGAAVLLLACLFTKPSLVAAPIAATGWLIWQSRHAPRVTRRRWQRAAALFLGSVGLGGGLIFALFQLVSGGWFGLHVVAANANRWDYELARGFWIQQFTLRWPLGAAALVGILWIMVENRSHQPSDHRSYLPLALLYTLGGLVTALGVGKVGAYSNYFLELYVGLVWIAALAAGRLDRLQRGVHVGIGSVLYVLLSVSLAYYPPLWDANRLRPAGLIDPSPPRLAFGRYGLWADAAREAAVFAALTRVGDALTAEVRAAGSPLFTDMPGVAAAAGVTARLQAFEMRQLLDQGLADERLLLYELANGLIPLAVIDHLGNWLTPASVTILTHRYAQDGSLGTFDLYRPVDAGLDRPCQQRFVVRDSTLHLVGYSLAPPPGAAYEPGDMLIIGLRWSVASGSPTAPLTVTMSLVTPHGMPLLRATRPLLYGVFPPQDWPPQKPVQHIHILELPPDLPDGIYGLTVTLGEAAPDRLLTHVAVAKEGGTYMPKTGYFVPAALHRAWADLGGVKRAGYPLTPATPFAWGRLQCFERVCLELRHGAVRTRPLGAQVYLAETIRSDRCLDGTPAAGTLCPDFAAFAQRLAMLGEAISGEVERNGWIVQWTTEARLERQADGSAFGLGRLGDEILRLPPGVRYRWPYGLSRQD